MLQSLGLEGSEAVMIGNSMEADVAGARPFGMKTVHVMFGDSTDEGGADPDITVFAVTDIVPAIKRIAAEC
jgi:FMN phosphatase YigB (HAD superfamily)